MATTKKKASPAKKAAAPKKKAVAKKPAASAKKAESAGAAGDLDRKGLAARARQLKSELLAIRFNLQSPSLTEFRKKRRELASVLARLS